jgi:multiple sugar transport system permease protein
VLLGPAVFFVLGVIAYPLALAVWYSLTDATVGEPGSFIGLAQYSYLVRDPEYRAALWHTFAYDGLSVALKLLLGTALAFALLRPFRGRRALYTVLLLPLLFPVVMVSITWYFLLSDVHGVFNYILLLTGVVHQEYAFLGTGTSALLSLVAINVWHGTPLFMVLALAGLQSVSQDLLDSARVDGAGPWSRFWHLQLPALVPGLALASLLSILGTFGDYAIVHLVTAGGPGGSTNIVSSLAFVEALRLGDLATGIAIGLSVVPAYLAALAVVVWILLRR